LNYNLQAAVIVIVTFLVILGFVLFYLIHRQKSQNEIRKALIERFGAAQDLGAFLQSEGGQHFLTGLSTAMACPLGSVLGAVQKGIILCMLFLGCMLASMVMNSHEIMALGAVLGAIGVGFLISAAASHRMARKWGLLDKPSSDLRWRESGK